MNALSLAELRERFSLKNTTKESFAFSLLPAGIPRGALAQWTGASKTSLLLSFLREQPELSVAWIEPKLVSNPVAIAQQGGGLGRIFFSEAGEDWQWVILQVLRSGLFPIVILREEATDERNLRKLQLAAENAHSTVVFLSERSSQAWPFAQVLHIGNEGIKNLRARA